MRMGNVVCADSSDTPHCPALCHPIDAPTAKQIHPNHHPCHPLSPSLSLSLSRARTSARR